MQEDTSDGRASSGLSSLTHPSQDECGYSDTEADSSSAIADANPASYPITACGSQEFAMHLQCHMGAEPSACQVTIPAPLGPVPASCPAFWAT